MKRSTNDAEENRRRSAYRAGVKHSKTIMETGTGSDVSQRRKMDLESCRMESRCDCIIESSMKTRTAGKKMGR